MKVKQHATRPTNKIFVDVNSQPQSQMLTAPGDEF
jgi:hypothetical protein